MRRPGLKASLRGWIAVAFAGCAMALTGCGSRDSGSAGVGATTTGHRGGPAASQTSRTLTGAPALTVSPTRGGPRTRFSLRFVAPITAGVEGSSRVAFTLSLTGGNGSGGCLGARTLQVPPATKGVPVVIALSPASLGGPWCPGTHTARVVEVQGPVCAPGTMCPQYLRVVGTVGRATFSVGRAP